MQGLGHRGLSKACHKLNDVVKISAAVSRAVLLALTHPRSCSRTGSTFQVTRHLNPTIWAPLPPGGQYALPALHLAVFGPLIVASPLSPGCHCSSTGYLMIGAAMGTSPMQGWAHYPCDRGNRYQHQPLGQQRQVLAFWPFNSTGCINEVIGINTGTDCLDRPVPTNTPLTTSCRAWLQAVPLPISCSGPSTT